MLGQALEDLDECIRREPWFPEAYISRGRCYQALQDFHHAVNEFNKGMQVMVIRAQPRGLRVCLCRSQSHQMLSSCSSSATAQLQFKRTRRCIYRASHTEVTPLICWVLHRLHSSSSVPSMSTRAMQLHTGGLQMCSQPSVTRKPLPRATPGCAKRTLRHSISRLLPGPLTPPPQVHLRYLTIAEEDMKADKWLEAIRTLDAVEKIQPGDFRVFWNRCSSGGLI